MENYYFQSTFAIEYNEQSLIMYNDDVDVKEMKNHIAIQLSSTLITTTKTTIINYHMTLFK